MALTRKGLASFGVLSEDQIDTIIDWHLETVNPLKDENKDLKTKVANTDAIQSELDKANAKLEEMSGTDSWQTKYDSLLSDFDSYKQKVEAEKLREQKTAKYKELLHDLDITDEKSVAKVVKYSDIDAMELDEDGMLKNSAEIAKAVKEEWSEQATKTVVKGADVANPPANTGGKTQMTKEEIFAIKDDEARQRAIAENHELFGF